MYRPGETRRVADKPLVSVVTPYFNTVNFLEESIQSVLKQTYRNWEYILVDNCSTDGSSDIAHRYAAIDSRVHLYREVEFLGQVENYNRALKYISPESKYCKIVQADDLIYPHCLAEMVEVAEIHDNVGLISSFTLYGDTFCHGGLALSSGPVYRGRNAAKGQLLGKVLFGSPTCVMYRSEIVRSCEAFFSATIPYFEDTEVCFRILRTYDFGFVPQVLTVNRKDNTSIWSELNRHGPIMLCDVMFTHLFGSEFLDHDEFVKRLAEVEKRYYRLLAQGALKRYGRDFWEFHTKGLKSIGKEISSRRIAVCLFSMMLDTALNPKRTFESIWAKMGLHAH